MVDEIYFDPNITAQIAQDALVCLSRGYSIEMYAAERGIPLNELEAILDLYEMETIFYEYSEAEVCSTPVGNEG